MSKGMRKPKKRLFFLLAFVCAGLIFSSPAIAGEEKRSAVSVYDAASEYVLNVSTKVAEKRKMEPISEKEAQYIVFVIASAAQEMGLPFSLLMGLYTHESGFCPGIKSQVGAHGVGQVMPFHFENYGLSPGSGDVEAEVSKSVFLGAQILRRYYEQFGDIEKGILAYNNGPGNVSKGRIPNPSFLPKVLGAQGRFLRFCAERGVVSTGMESLEALVEDSIFSRKKSQGKRSSGVSSCNPEPVLSEVEDWLKKH
jgi:soluble lytic murein transglycosylase-like protein